ncbi:MAG: hypothetical protein ACI9VR_000503 [Cognaticolwellia sp.]
MRALLATPLLALSSLLFSATALAARPPVDSQVRLHVGLSLVEAPSPLGFSFGVDSRVSRNLSLDAGVFGSMPGELETTSDRTVTRDHVRLRHGLYTMPGLRIPHPQPRSFRWDVYVRAGPGVVWTEDTWSRAPDNVAGQMDPAGFAGVDGVIVKNALGVRLGVRTAMTSVYDAQLQSDQFFWAPQYNLEMVYQFGVKGTVN